MSENRKRIKKRKKPKQFDYKYSELILQSLPFKLTNGQKSVLEEINSDLNSSERMLRIIQGDVGSGKTIVSLLAIINVIKSGYQCALMSPTEILANQHYQLSKKIFEKIDLKIDFLTSKTEIKQRKNVLKNLSNGKLIY